MKTKRIKTSKNRIQNFLSDGDTMLLFPLDRTFVLCSEGTGDNLLDSDIEEGYIDYINFTSYSLSIDCGDPAFQEIDGGMAMFKKYVTDLTDEELIAAICYEADIKSKVYIVL